MIYAEDRGYRTMPRRQQPNNRKGLRVLFVEVIGVECVGEVLLPLIHISLQQVSREQPRDILASIAEIDSLYKQPGNPVSPVGVILRFCVIQRPAVNSELGPAASEYGDPYIRLNVRIERSLLEASLHSRGAPDRPVVGKGARDEVELAVGVILVMLLRHAKDDDGGEDGVVLDRGGEVVKERDEKRYTHMLVPVLRFLKFATAFISEPVYPGRAT